LAMFSLKRKYGYDVQPSYNFESPRIGDAMFASFFKEIFGKAVPLFRITHANDALPRFPQDGGYTHVGFQVWYPGQDTSTYTVCADFESDPLCGNDGLSASSLCPLAKSDCTDDRCTAECEFPPMGGPHCRNPLAPASNFCSFAGDTIEHHQELFEQSCVWGKAALTDDTCFSKDVAWSPLDLDLLSYPCVELPNVEACQERCSRIIGCEHFSYSPADGGCHVTGSEATPVKGSVGFIAGPKVCNQPAPESKFLRLGNTEIDGGRRSLLPGSTAAFSGLAILMVAAAASLFLASGRRLQRQRTCANEEMLRDSRAQAAYGPVDAAAQAPQR